MEGGRRLLGGAVMVVVGGVVGYALPESNASPTSASGSLISVGNATKDAGILLDFQPAKGPRESLQLQDATPWQGTAAGPWHMKGQPPSTGPRTTPRTQMTLGIVTARSRGS